MRPDQSETKAEDDREAGDLQWLAELPHRTGRPLRVLHIGNIANNAFNNARIQRKYGIEADVLCADNYHIMATPEWEEARFKSPPDDAFFPDWRAVDLRGYERPRWFAAAPLRDACRYLEARSAGRGDELDRLWQVMEFERYIRCSRDIRARAALTCRKIGWKLRYELQRLTARLETSRGRAENLAREAGARGMPELTALWRARNDTKPFPAQADDLAHYWERFRHISPLFSHYDIVQGYAQDGIWALLAGKPYMAYEHGTLRHLPFEDTPVGRMVALVYGLADHVFITNLDCIVSAGRLGLEPSRITYLPHAFDDARLRRFRAANADQKPAGDALKLFMPARQDWQDGDPNLAKGNDRFFRAAARLAQEGRPIAITAIGWGRDMAASKALIRDLGLEANVTWVEPMQKAELWRAYLRHHAIIDQFRLDAFGGVTFEALALGRRVITALDTETAELFFGQAPPLFAADSVDKIATALRQINDDREDSQLIGEQAASWIERYHSARRITALQARDYRKQLDDMSDCV